MEPPAPVLRNPEAKSRLECIICMDFVLTDPVYLDPCQDFFCRACITEYFRTKRNKDCPSCRRPHIAVRDLKSQPLLHRIWNDTEMKCGKAGCPWFGDVTGALAHMKECTYIDPVPKLEKEIDDLKKERTKLQGDVALAENRRTDTENNFAYYKSRYDIASQQLLEKSAKVKTLERELEQSKMELKKLNSKLNSKPAVDAAKFHAMCNFARFNVVSLTQVICRYIHDKPATIDHKKLFISIRQCNEALEKKYSDNPANFGLHMQMLLSTCLVSNWFSSNQHLKMEEWMLKQGWSPS